MALQSEELFETVGTQAARLRIVPTLNGTAVKSFATGSGTIKRGTPVGVVTASKLLALWDSGNSPAGTNVIEAIVLDDVVLNGSGEVPGRVMLQGEIHVDDIVYPAGESITTLRTEYAASGLREKGLIIRGDEQFA
jgi:hypothetical protein